MPPQRRAYRSLLPLRRARRPRRAKLAWATTSARQTLRPPVGARTPRSHCTRPERRLHGNNRRGPHIASTPAPGVRRKNATAATLSQIKFFHSMWTNLFAVAGSREHPPAGVIRKRGRSAPSCAQCGRAGAPFLGRAMRAPTRGEQQMARRSARNSCPCTAGIHLALPGESQRRTP